MSVNTLSPSKNALKVSTVLISVVQKKLRCIKIKYTGRDPISNKWQSRGLNPGRLAPESVL